MIASLKGKFLNFHIFPIAFFKNHMVKVVLETIIIVTE